MQAGAELETQNASAPPAYEIVLARTPAERQQCYDIRVAVFHVEQGFPLDTEFDESDDAPDTAHFLLRTLHARAPAGTVRCTRPAGAAYSKLTRLAVRAEHRAGGLGGALVRALHAWVLAQQAPAPAVVVCHAQIPVKAFYAGFGYVPEGAEFDEDGAPHQKMVLRMDA